MKTQRTIKLSKKAKQIIEQEAQKEGLSIDNFLLKHLGCSTPSKKSVKLNDFAFRQKHFKNFNGCSTPRRIRKITIIEVEVA